ncbi:MAG: tetratricopeptide repeat protein [Sphingobacteriaceae bacterium]
MSKKQTDSPATNVQAEKSTRKFVQENTRSLTIIGGAILALLLLYFGYQKFYLAPRAEKAANEMFKAEEYATIDSLADRAINGDGSYPGFEKIAEEYSSTKSANIANAYLGGLYLKKGEFEKAVEALGNYSSTGSIVIDPLVLGMMGDAYSELKDYDKAATYYKKAANKYSNSFTSPLFLKKLGLVYEEQKEFGSALKVYTKIKEEYPESAESSNIDEYIARVEAQQ